MPDTPRRPIPIGYELPVAGAGRARESAVSAARRAEAGAVDFLLLADRPATGPGASDPGPPAAIVTASYLATLTRRIGLVVAAAPAYHEPFNLARMIASLDHISGGRAGWSVATAPDERADANHRREGTDPAAGRDARTAEFVPLVKDLWDTWEDGAFIRDKASGAFVDGDRIHPLHHSGPAFRVRGPLNLARPPQGHPVVLAPAAPPGSGDGPWHEADAVLIGAPPAGGARAATAHASSTGRPHAPLTLAAITPVVAPTRDEARALHDEIGAPAGDGDRAVVAGDPADIADRIEAWADAGSADGFTVRFTPLPGQLAAFTDLVLPELRRRGRLRTAYDAPTLRGHLGLARPGNRLAARTAATAQRS
ncbi:LLM class flavin-dependent oxidoreductase [Nocardiopsis sediminis]|uniref:LLM class flavin-dependent oxidoreductase n=1 Tax=Nocardiopsis sediminis TaxID=1778267 RepID=A0ABV8FXM3_9ACTN